MTVNFNGVSRMLGMLLLVLGCCMVPSLATALIYHETAAAISFLVTIVPCFILGFISVKVYFGTYIVI